MYEIEKIKEKKITKITFKIRKKILNVRIHSDKMNRFIISAEK